MRSLFLSRLSRLCLRMKPPALELRHLGGARFLSNVTLGHIVGAERCGSTQRDGDIGKLVICDYDDINHGIKFLEKKVPMDLIKETGTIGASHRWVATLKEGVMRLQNDLDPSASDSDPKRISLPPLVTLPHCQTQMVTNVAMSSSSPEDEDCIVAVKFLGPQLSFCRPAQKNPEWINIRIEDPSFFVSSRVLYSKRDEMFSMAASGGTHRGSWDLEKHMHKPKIQAWNFDDYAEFVQSKMQQLDACCTTEHLVESRPTDELFIVKLFRNYEGGRMQVKHIMVFKLGENKYGHAATYTNDIGDLCIFLSKSEPFCLKASLYGLCTRNTVYYIENNEICGVRLDTNTETRMFSTFPASYFIPPQS